MQRHSAISSRRRDARCSSATTTAAATSTTTSSQNNTAKRMQSQIDGGNTIESANQTHSGNGGWKWECKWRRGNYDKLHCKWHEQPQRPQQQKQQKQQKQHYHNHQHHYPNLYEPWPWLAFILATIIIIILGTGSSMAMAESPILSLDTSSSTAAISMDANQMPATSSYTNSSNSNATFVSIKSEVRNWTAASSEMVNRTTTTTTTAHSLDVIGHTHHTEHPLERTFERQHQQQRQRQQKQQAKNNTTTTMMTPTTTDTEDLSILIPPFKMSSPKQTQTPTPTHSHDFDHQHIDNQSEINNYNNIYGVLSQRRLRHRNRNSSIVMKTLAKTQEDNTVITTTESLVANWKHNRTKVKRILKNKRNETNGIDTNGSSSSSSSSSSALLSNLSAWQQHNLRVNQVFESEWHMSRHQLQRNQGKIVLLGLFELSTRTGPRVEGLSELGAAMMAVDHINRKQLLKGYTLELVMNDTQCDPGIGVDRFFHAIYTQPTTRMVMLLGSACSEVTESLAKVVPYWNIVQVSFGSTSPALSDRQEFPYFFRTVAPDSSHNPARIAFIRRFGWDTVTTFSQNEEVHSLAVNDLVTELEAANISCAATITFAATDFKEQLLLLRETDTRIIIGSFSQDLAPQILCEAYRLRMFGADYAWILHESMGAPWWNVISGTVNGNNSSSSNSGSGSGSGNSRSSSSSSSNGDGTATSDAGDGRHSESGGNNGNDVDSFSRNGAKDDSNASGSGDNDAPENASGSAAGGGSQRGAATYCTSHELQEAVENLIIVSSHNSIVGNNISLSGLNNDMFSSQLREQFNQFQSLTSTIEQHAVAAALTDSRNRNQNRKHIRAAATDQKRQLPQMSGQRRRSSDGGRRSKGHPAKTAIGNLPNDAVSDGSNANERATVTSATSATTTSTISRYAPQTYDAVWAIALALRAADEQWHNAKRELKLDRFDYTRSDMAWEFLKQMGKLDFLGVSGPVSFSGPDRIGTTAFYQIQNGNLESIALYYPAEDALDFQCPRCKPVRWHSGQVPIAKRVFKLRVATIAPLAFYTIATLSSVGIALAIAFLAFNLHFRKLKAIKLSSPKLSNITAVGCIFVYAAVILLGLDYSTLPSAVDSFATVCTARVYLLSAGFSLAFGSMFAKTYRVHRIFTRTGSVFKDKMLQDIQLILLVCGLLLVDGLIVTLWVVTDPMERHLHNLTLEISSIDRSVVYQPQVEVCRSQHTQTWLGVLYAYKGLLLIVGVYMAWETRHVKIAALNDSQYIGVSVYSVVITSAIVVVLANLISERVTLAFITITALILISTTATLCLLFIPKLHDIWARNDIIDPVIHSMGLKMECNTRRFVIDDRRELQYRVEVQNRVYKKEIASLDTEIRKLERMLETGTTSTTTSSSTSLIAGQQKPELTVTSDMSIHLPPPLQTSTGKSRTPSISGILPNLLLSVLPPVIPRASWPSAEYMQVPMRRSVTFASQPQLEETLANACLPAQDLYNLRLAHQQATETAKTGLINRLRGIFARSASSNKGSNASLSDQKGLKAAFKSHMGLFTRLIPSSQTASCNAIYNTPRSDGDEVAGNDMHGDGDDHLTSSGSGGATGSAGRGGANLKPMHRLSFAKSGTHLDVTTADPNFLPVPTIFGAGGRRGSIYETLQLQANDSTPTTSGTIGKYIKAPETKVNFQLPANRRPSIAQVQPTMRERVRGSPRFPHRILPPTCSLSALEESEDRGATSPKQRMLLQKASGVGNWKSMEMSVKSPLSLDNSEEELCKKSVPITIPIPIPIPILMPSTDIISVLDKNNYEDIEQQNQK